MPFEKYAEMGAYHWTECNRSAPNYNPALHARYRIVADRVPAGGRVLDIGCGDGYLMGQVASRSVRVAGIDSELAALRYARQKLSSQTNCELVYGSGYFIPFADASFDTVLITDVIEHLTEPDVCVSELARVLTGDGTLLLTTPKWRPDRWWDEIHEKEYRPEELDQLLGARFRDVSISFFWPLSWSRRYKTRFGWHAIRLLARYAYNPFYKEGAEPERFGQLLAVCRGPRNDNS